MIPYSLNTSTWLRVALSWYIFYVVLHTQILSTFALLLIVEIMLAYKWQYDLFNYRITGHIVWYLHFKSKDQIRRPESTNSPQYLVKIQFCRLQRLFCLSFWMESHSLQSMSPNITDKLDEYPRTPLPSTKR